MLEFMPGSPFNDEKLTADQIAVLNAKYGLDKPIIIRFLNYIKNMLTGDFGVSYTISKNTPIAELLKTRLLYSNGQPFKSTVMPTVALCMFTIATVARFTRTELLEVLGTDYILLAESKGISGPQLIIKHQLRNALIPIITVIAPLVVDLMTGSLVVEKIFSIPGIGSLLVTAIQSNDYNVIIALSFIYSAMYIGIMLVVDILYGVIDPRIRLAKGDGNE